jgi:cyclic pyranopterin phosphate synthase
MPEEGVELTPDQKLLQTDEIVSLAKLFVSQGVDKIRLTGGEPTVRKDFVEIVRQLGQIQGLNEICVTSNGIALPRKLPLLKEYGLTSLNLSLDTLVEAKYEFMTRRKGLNRVLEAIDVALAVGIPKIKINVVVMRGQNEEEMCDFVEKFVKHYPVEVRFIEYMPFEGNKWSKRKMYSYMEMMEQLRSRYPDMYRRNHIPGETAKVFEIPGYAGRVGLITSMTSLFCSTCNRLRITADGSLKVCLFGNAEVSLRDMLRSGASEKKLLDLIALAVRGKKEKHAGIGELENMKNRPMILIGG